MTMVSWYQATTNVAGYPVSASRKVTKNEWKKLSSWLRRQRRSEVERAKEGDRGAVDRLCNPPLITIGYGNG